MTPAGPDNPSPQSAASPAGPQTSHSWFDTPGNATSTSHLGTTQDSAGQNGDDNPTAHLIGRTSIALIVIIGIILLCAWALKRLGMGRMRRGYDLPIVASRALGQKERIVVVEIENEWLVLGVTAQQINTLHRLDAPADRPTAEGQDGIAGATDGFGQILAENLARLTGRRRS